MPAPKPEKAKRKRLGFRRPAPASQGIEGTEKEKRRTQTIADSLDLGVGLAPDLEGGGTRPESGQPNRVVGKGDKRLERRREAIITGMPVGKRRSVG